jgi:glycosyltransferase involved in cell wall biosynthesis
MISVIMAVYKEDVSLLKQSIESILNQTYRDFEYVIVLDDPDNDEAIELIRGYEQQDSRLHFFINEKNSGPAITRNNAFNKTFYTREQMIALNFESTDSKLHYAIPCLNKDLFVDVEKKLYDKFPEYKERNNIFLSQGKTVLRFKTVGENQLESGIPIIMQV